MKRSISILLALVMLLSITTSAFADGAPAGEPEKVTVTLHPNGGVFPNEFDQIKGCIEVELGEGRALTFAEANERAPQREGYEFLGWFTQETEGEQVPVDGAVPENVTDLYAQWKFIPRTVILHVINGGLGGTYGDKSLSGEVSVVVTLEGEEGRLPNVDTITATRGNGTFLGWYTQAPIEEQKTQDDYSYWTTVSVNGQPVDPGDPVPADVATLYAVFQDNEGPVKEKDKRVTFYLDYNGVNGKWGPSMTVTREYTGEGGYALTGEDLLVKDLNWDGGELSDLTDTGLKGYWDGKNSAGGFNGYTFLGWALDPKAESPTVHVGDKIANGASLYAVWTKGDANSWTFQRVDPEAAPVTGMHVTGSIGSHTTGTMTWSAHAKVGETVQFTIATTPSRATFDKLIWTVSDGSKTVEVTPGQEAVTLGNATVVAEGKNVTITYTGNATDKYGNLQAMSITADARAVVEGGKTVANSGLPGTASFAHSYAFEVKEAATCGEKTVTTYTCPCGAKYETEATKPHVYNSLMAEDRGYKVIQAPTCTEDGVKHLLCLRCGYERPDNYPIPALGHDFQVTGTMPAACNKNEVTETCTRCSTQQTSLVPASNPDLHVWKEYDRLHSTCKEDTVYERCTVCGEYRNRKEAADNEHSFAYVSRMPVDCQQSLYTFECVYGCGTKKVMLKKEVNNDMHKYEEVSRYPSDCAHTNYTYKCSVCSAVKAEMKKEANPQLHVWGEWVETTPATEWQGGVQERTCGVCGAKETKATATLVRPSAETPAEPEPELAPEDNGEAAVASVVGASAASYAANSPITSSNAVASAGTAKKLSTPKNLKASASGTSIKISWGKVSGAEQYQILYKTGSGSWKKLAKTTGTSYTWKKAKAGTKYTFTVQCVSADGKTNTSSYNAKGVSCTAKKLAAPKVTKAAKVSGGIKITWKKVTGAEKYQVLYKVGNGSWKKLAKTTGTSYTWKKAKSGTKYTFAVRCVSADGKTYTSAQSAGKTITYKK